VQAAISPHPPFKPCSVLSRAEATAPRPGRELLERFTPIVHRIASAFQRRLPCNVLRDDLVAAGMSGLWDAIQKHGDDAEGNFEWYVRVRIRGAILDELRAQDWLPRRARAAASRVERDPRGPQQAAPSVVRFEDVGEYEQYLAGDGTHKNAEEIVELKLERESLQRVISQLPERERHIVAMHYFGGVKFKDLGRELGVSEPRISQLHSRAMGRLRGLLEDTAA
jgi:RNA polymerase sigma factor FliA